MKLRMFQVDAFTIAGRPFTGNPAAVCPLDAPLPPETMQSIAMENNLSETAFVVRRGDAFDIRWFTPSCEIDLCGHATLASAFVVMAILDTARTRVAFQSKSGELVVTRDGDRFTLDFPARAASPLPNDTAKVEDALGVRPAALLAARDYLVVLEREADVLRVAPDMAKVAALARHAVIVTAPGDSVDFVSRFFAPEVGVPEDPVTGSAHCTLIPYWSERLGKTKLHAMQRSARGGELFCEHRGERVSIGGGAVLYLDGTIVL